MISVSSLNRTFGAIRAVSSVNFEVSDGEIFGIVGPDGAGKSTLLRMLSAILLPDSGTIRIGDMNVFENPYKIKEKIAYMPQRFGLYEDLTVEENIFFFGRLFGLGKREIRSKLPVLYNFSNLEPFSGRLAGQLSGGMKQKLGLACCLVHDPDLILLDEPTNGVDPVSRREFWKILYNLLSGGVTIILSTAYLDEAERCGRVALMYRGEFIRVGSPEEIKAMTDSTLLEILCVDPVRGEKVFKKDPNYFRVIRTGGALRIFVQDKSEIRSIKKILSGNKIRFTDVREIKPSLEDTFVEVISRIGATE